MIGCTEECESRNTVFIQLQSSQFPISFPGRNQKGNANRLQLNGNCCSVLLSRMCQYWNEIYHQKDESFRETKEDFYFAKSGLVTNPILLSQET